MPRTSPRILAAAGYDDATIARVQAIVRKEGLGRDAAVQVHEDALCLVFLQTQFDELIERLGHDKAVEVVAKTAGQDERGRARGRARPAALGAGARRRRRRRCSMG